MLEIVVPSVELFDEATETFINTKETVLKLEHSLLSISKWESKWCKPFLPKDKDDKRSPKELLDYVRCMTLNSNVPKNVYNALSADHFDKISEYINSPMTASSVNYYKSPTNGAREIVTSELIYYWMIVYQIPFECEKWHINRLLMLIRICNAKNDPKRMSSKEVMSQNRALNRARRKALHTRG